MRYVCSYASQTLLFQHIMYVLAQTRKCTSRLSIQAKLLPLQLNNSHKLSHIYLVFRTGWSLEELHVQGIDTNHNRPLTNPDHHCNVIMLIHHYDIS